MPGKSALTLEVTGIKETLNNFKNIFNDVDTSPIVLEALSIIGKEVEGKAKDILQEKIYSAPQRGDYVRTGLLRARTTSDKAINQRGEVSVTVRSKQEYAAYIEYGTSRMKPRAFLLPAAVGKADEALKILMRALTNFLELKSK